MRQARSAGGIQLGSRWRACVAAGAEAHSSEEIDFHMPDQDQKQGMPPLVGGRLGRLPADITQI